MGYDSNKDKLIEEAVSAGGDMRVCIFQYGDGDKKVCMQRLTEFKDRETGETKTVWTNKVGRLNKNEASELLGMFQQMMDKL